MFTPTLSNVIRNKNIEGLSHLWEILNKVPVCLSALVTAGGIAELVPVPGI